MNAVPGKWQIVYYGDYRPAKVNYVILDLFGFDADDVRKVKEIGAIPIAYVSSQYEDWRPDAKQFGRKLGKLDNWPGEFYVDPDDVRNREVMINRIRLAQDKGFAGLDWDNVDAHYNSGGYSRDEGREYFAFLLENTQEAGLLCGLKNTVEDLDEFGDDVDFFVSEASDEDELKVYRSFNKPAVHMDYGDCDTPDYIYELPHGRNNSRFE